MLIRHYDFYQIYYYTLEDMIAYGYSNHNKNTISNLYGYWTSIANDHDGDYFIVTAGLEDSTKTIVNNFMKEYLIPKCSGYYVDLLDDGDEMSDYDHSLFWRRFGLFINETAPRYSYLIEMFESQKSNLLNAVKTVTESESKGIDTPQDINIPSASSVEASNHISSLAGAKTETSSDYGTLMSRIVEIRQNLENIYSLWLNDFRRQFLIIVED